jgi:hypothetical protein
MMTARQARRTKQFYVTIGGLEYYEDIRRDFLCYFSDLEEYCVSVESNNVNKSVHIHAYLQFHDSCSVVSVRDCFEFS